MLGDVKQREPQLKAPEVGIWSVHAISNEPQAKVKFKCRSGRGTHFGRSCKNGQRFGLFLCMAYARRCFLWPAFLPHRNLVAVLGITTAE